MYISLFRVYLPFWFRNFSIISVTAACAFSGIDIEVEGQAGFRLS